MPSDNIECAFSPDDTEFASRGVYPGIFLVSATVLLLEISLTRIFSYTIWYHFTYVTISLAMLGFGASGAVLAASEKLAKLELKLAYYTSLIAAISVPIMLIVISQVPFYPFQLFKEPKQIAYMILYYVAVTLPFFCAGLTISCAFRSLPHKASKIYFWDLVGAGTGCFIVVSGIHLFGVPSVAALCTSLFLLAATMLSVRGARLPKLLIAAAALVWIPFGLNVERVLQFKASKEKWINKMENKEITFKKWSPIFRVDAYNIIENGERVIAFIAHDGDACAMVVKSDPDLSGFERFEKKAIKAPYLLKDNPTVFIIGPGGGVDVGIALKNKARSILAIELDPITVDLVVDQYSDFGGRLYERPEVTVVTDEGRSFLRRTGEKFDLIELRGVDTLAALSSGAYVLAENNLYTVEAYKEFLDHLNPDGILCIAIMDMHYRREFPRHSVRQVSLSIKALAAAGIKNPRNHLAVISESTGGIPASYVIILTKKSAFTRTEVGTLAKFVEELSFDPWYLPGRKADNPCANIIQSSEKERKAYYERHPLKLTAPNDEIPFFFHFYKWRTLLKEHKIDTRHSMATGQLILLLILLLSIVFSVVLIIYPLFRFQQAGLQTRRKWSYILYFAALGLGFIFLEISYIQRFILFLGYPTYSLSVILFSMLTFSGIGSYLSGRLSVSPKRIITVAVVLLAAVAFGHIIMLPPIFKHCLSASRQLRIAISLLLLLPLGLLLGVFFPTGIKIISAENRRFVPWAWGINGCASVIGTVLSIIIAMSYGFDVVTIIAVIIYSVGVCAMFLAYKKPEEMTPH